MTKHHFGATTAIALAIGVSTSAYAQSAPTSSSPSGQIPSSGEQTTNPPNTGTTASAPASVAATEPDQKGLADIVVTAQRRSENLQRVPIAVTALSADTLATRGITDTRQLATTVPGLTFTTQATLAAPRIRGVGTAIAGAGNENPISTYVDGVYYAAAGAQVLSFNNISQVAVLKGPQGTLFGRNATGGLIQITTRDPSENLSGLADITYGNHNTLGGNLYVTGGGGGFAADLAVHYQDQMDGFGKNLFNGDDVNRTRNLSLRSKLRAELGADTTATLILDWSKSRSNLPAYRPVDGSLPFDGKRFSGGKFDINDNITPRTVVEQYGAALNLSHDFGGVKLVSITAYRWSNFDTRFDSDGQPENYISAKVYEPGRQFSQEVQLISNGSGPFTWQLGAYYFYYRDGFLPGIVPLPLFGFTSNVVTDQRTFSIAGYAQGTYKFDDRTSLTIGARLTSEKKKIDGSGSLDFGAFAVPQGPYSASTRVTKPTWRIALDHRLTPDTLVYVSYNRGFKSGGFDPSATAAPTAFKPEVLDAFEVGLKTQFADRRVRLNAAGFYYDYKDIQLNTFRNGLTSIYNGDSAKIYGLDADLTVAATDNLTLTGGLSLLHHRFGDFPITYTAPIPTGGVANLPDASASGKRLPNTPDWQLNIGAEYRVPLSQGSILLAADYFHSGRWYNTPENRLFQPAYDLVNASATWFIDSANKYSLRVWGRNLGNVAYAEQITIQAPVADFVSMSQGRTFGATFGVRF